MKEITLSVTKASRNFSACISRVRDEDVTFVLTRHGVAVARLKSANEERVCTGRDLARVLSALALPDREVKLWRRDFVAARKTLKRPVNKWR